MYENLIYMRFFLQNRVIVFKLFNEYNSMQLKMYVQILEVFNGKQVVYYISSRKYYQF